ncbi:UNVERIFIED_CONTAM: protein GLUTAMINE DUMPER 5 [Sesamum calycinum]|uniref:Protein GLUTAMINE DUMPER 5 n=2 Tax=Sesamum TaxID=4181 RepID=A0AAW2SVH2_9LAMI
MMPKIQHPTNTTTAAAGGGFQRWSSPVPYLFGSLALVLGVIAMALVILVCSYRSPSSEEKPEKSVHALQPDMEPRVVVIMAGETNPTHLAKPLAARRPVEEV